MPAIIDGIEVVILWLGAASGLCVLAYAIYNMLKSLKAPSGIQTGVASKVLRTPYLVIATLLFIVLGVVLWKPLPIQVSWQMRLLLVIVGGGIFFSSLFLYLWGMRTLGANFNAASGFGVRLHQAHQLITSGPYAYIRHPMYLAVILAGWGGLLLYRSWTMLVSAVIMLGLFYRAAKEEDALAQAFGGEWQDYKRRVPGWIPHSGTLLRKYYR
jgi:protein-S-isoprenylcysteine O-methyltransferase Ste14